MVADVDSGKHVANWSLTAGYSQFANRILYLAGNLDVRELGGAKATQNYHGCLRNVSFTSLICECI